MERRRMVEQQVAAFLGACHAFGALPDHRREQLHRDMVLVVYALAEKGVVPRMPTGSAGALHEGLVDALGKATVRTVDNVNFPDFVTGLINGVFGAIVGSSIQQMEDYASLFSNLSAAMDGVRCVEGGKRGVPKRRDD